MPRPKKCRKVGIEACWRYFSPASALRSGDTPARITIEELEAVRLKDREGLTQSEAASRMGISQPTFCRIITSARKKIADALVSAKTIKIEN